MLSSGRMDVPRIPLRTFSTPGTNTRANTSPKHVARTHRRPTSSPTSRPSSSNLGLLALPILILTTLVSLAHAASSDTLTLNLPHVPTTCETLNLTWTGGTANYTLYITQPHGSAPPETRSALKNTSLLWTANACGGVGVSLTLRDAGGYESAVSFTVQRGTDGSCLSAAQQNTIGCLVWTSAAKTSTSGDTEETGTTGTDTNNKAGGGPRVGVVVGVVVGIGVLVMVLATGCFLRARRRRGAGVLGPGSRPYFVRHERNRARRRGTLLEMPPPAYSDSAATNEEHRSGHTSDSSPSPPVSDADHDQTRPLMPVPETVEMAQLPRGRVDPEQLPTPFLSTYEGSSATTASSEGHARESTSAGASHSSAPAPANASAPSGGEVPLGKAGSDEPPPPYTLTA